MFSRRQPPKIYLPLDVPEGTQILRTSRAQLYYRIGECALPAQRKEASTYISLTGVERYVICR